MRRALALVALLGCAPAPAVVDVDAGADAPRIIDAPAPPADSGSDVGSDAPEPPDAPVPTDSPRPPETDCANRDDDDLDGDTDCADSDCEGRACDDADPCTGSDACAAGVCDGVPGRPVQRCTGPGDLEVYALEDGCPSECSLGDSGVIWRVPPDPVGAVVTLRQWRPRGCTSVACAMTGDACIDAIVDIATVSPAPTTYCREDPGFGDYPTTAAPGLIAVRRVGDAICRHGVRLEDEVTPAGMSDELVLAYVCPP